MILQETAFVRRRRQTNYNYGREYTISGANGSRIVNGSNAEYIRGTDQWYGSGSTSVSQGVIVYAYSGPASIPAEEEYDPEMVALLLRLDAEAPAAEFDNVIDMMDWLNRD